MFSTATNKLLTHLTTFLPMNRAILCSAIEGVVSKFGYDFTLNDDAYYPATLCRYPAAFLSQPKFVAMEGRKEGRITYKVSLYLAQQGAKLSPKGRNDLLAEMEEQMVNIFVELSQHKRIAVVRELTIKPLAGAIDQHGALTMVAEANIETIF